MKWSLVCERRDRGPIWSHSPACLTQYFLVRKQTLPWAICIIYIPLHVGKCFFTGVACGLWGWCCHILPSTQAAGLDPQYIVYLPWRTHAVTVAWKMTLDLEHLDGVYKCGTNIWWYNLYIGYFSQFTVLAHKSRRSIWKRLICHKWWAKSQQFSALLCVRAHR